jgi:hypothetical protein
MTERGRVHHQDRITRDPDDAIETDDDPEPDEWAPATDDDEPDDARDDLDVCTADDTVPILEAAAQQATTWYRGGRILVPTAMTCRVCGCTDDHGCPGGCLWVAPDLCSRCARRLEDV